MSGFSNLAARRTQATLLAATGDMLIAGGAAIRVYGIIIANAGATDIQVSIQTALPTVGADTEMVIAVPAHTTFEQRTNWMADEGVNIDSTGITTTVYVTVFHSHPGT